MTKMGDPKNVVIYGSTTREGRIREMRERYQAYPGSSVAGIARLHGVDREFARQAITGHFGGKNLVQDRIANAAAIQAKMHVRVRPEPRELRPNLKDSCMGVPRLTIAGKRRIAHALKPKRKPYESLCGASIRRFQRERQAKIRESRPPEVMPSRYELQALRDVERAKEQARERAQYTSNQAAPSGAVDPQTQPEAPPCSSNS